MNRGGLDDISYRCGTLLQFLAGVGWKSGWLGALMISEQLCEFLRAR